MNVWLLQTGEPLHIDEGNPRPMRAMNLSNALVAAGHRVVVWSASFHHLQKLHRSRVAATYKVNDSLEIRLIPSMGYQKNIGIGRLMDHAQMALNLRRLVSQETVLPDVAFVGYPPIETAAFLTPWLARHGVPVLLDVKDQWPKLFLEAFPPRLRLAGALLVGPYFVLARRAMKAATGISTMADGYMNWATRFAGRNRNAYDAVFPLTSPMSRISQTEFEEARQWRAKMGFAKIGDTRILFVGTFMSVFDFSPVFDAAKRALENGKKVQFILCGDGGFIKGIQDLMDGLSNVHFTGWLDRPKIEALAECSHATIAPYLNIENFTMNIPNKIIDALSLGLPLLCPLQGEVAELISRHDVGLRYGEEVGKSLYDCIRTLIDGPEIRNRMSRNALSLYRKKYTYEIVYGGMVGHLEKMSLSSGKLQKRSS